MDSITVSTITGAVDFSTIVVGIGAITAGIVFVLVAYRGAIFMIDQLRDAHSYHSGMKYAEDEDIEAAYGSRKRWFM